MNAPEFNLTQTPEIKKQITKLEDFITRQNEIQKQIESGTNIGKNHHKLLEKVLKFKMMLKESFNEDIDPITYLENLYYKEKLSMDSIVLKLKEMYIKLGETNYFYNSSSALQKFLVNVLNWKLRDASENKTTKV
ncbi:MAG: hypothetical protein PHG82_05640, partial [Candidatus Gracilibacteria bacterium]|nr:hypothetical protein [Candidatus Gracilibacteria bacterium]